MVELEAKMAEHEAIIREYEKKMGIPHVPYGAIERVQPSITFNNGAKCPMFGLGTYLLNDAEHIRMSVIECGYRMLDCASFYKNEEIVG